MSLKCLLLLAAVAVVSQARSLNGRVLDGSLAKRSSTGSSATATETPEPVVVTISTTETITNIETNFTTIYPTAVNTFVKREEIAYPPWLPTTYPATRVSSACSCFIASPSPPVLAVFTTTVITLTNTATTTLEPLTNTDTTIITATASATTLVIETEPETPAILPAVVLV
ncbi:hypothetical protein TWF506_008058 [Arthrobotrys conoides]|uniref:Uncharacterized protein n=1 Tax=Arthrobotrys conoides TaxID=74498 RepID=A0AAN8RX42_9PEZI